MKTQARGSRTPALRATTTAYYTRPQGKRGPRHFVLARALEAEGRPAEANEAYARYRDVLGGADTDLPLQAKIRTVRERLDRAG